MQELTAIILIACLLKISSCESIVETKNGYLKSTAAELDDVEAFLGIPYAEPPVGDLRFAMPVPKQPWTKIHHASSLSPPCMQHPVYPLYTFFPDTSNMSEDCLYLNIWKPKAKPNGLLRPIIIFIHFGAFILGSSNIDSLDGSILASKGDMVVVTINYRLGLFGFFLTNINGAGGNMGMYDQIMAIKWVKDNAQYFEGDPDNIILMGSSAGAMSVSAHIISPLSRNLFKRAVVLSGTMLNSPWMDANEKVFKSSELVASIAGCTNETVTLRRDSRSVLKCLKEKPKEVLLEAHNRFIKTTPVTFFPTVGDKFLPDDPVSVYREGKFRRDIDIMVGNNRNEGSLLMLLSGMYEYLGRYGNNPIKVSRSLATNVIRVFSSNVKVKKPSQKVNYYLNGIKNRTSDGYLKAISDLIGDVIISCSSVFMADFLSLKGNKVYFYKFGHRSASSPMADWVGVTHSEDVQYAFGHALIQANFTAEDVDLSNRYIARLSAFAYTGNPNVPGQLPWLQYSYNDPLYLNVGQDEESIRLKPWDRCEIWRKHYNAEIEFDLNNLKEIEPPSDLNSRSGMNSANRTGSFIAIPIMILVILLLRDSVITYRY